MQRTSRKVTGLAHGADFRILAAVVLVGLVGASAVLGQGAPEDIMIATDGASEYVIAVAEDAIVPEQTAARELQEHLLAITGAELPIVTEAAAGDRATVIFVGQTGAFAEYFADIDLEALGQDGIVLKRIGPRIFLSGGRPRGTLYAVYSFLEDYLGCRWWTSKASFIPSLPTLAAPDLDEVYVPRFSYREQFYLDTNHNGVFASRLKLNGTVFHNPNHQRIPEEYGGHHLLLGWVHTFWMLMPHDKYAGAHPEWYSMIGGERVAKPEPGHPRNVQLCLTNDEMRAELTKNALRWLRDNPRATMISITPNDGHGACQCPECQAVVDREETQAGPIIDFVNKVAEEIEKEFPDVLVETMAYSYYQKPPLHVRPRHNVLIRKASFHHTSWAEPFGEGEQNAIFRGHLEEWSTLADQLFIWDYVTNFSNYILPHPNLRVIAPNLRWFADNKVIGMFMQGDAHCSVGDFVEMRAWVQAQLMWRLDRDIEALIDEFLAGYYRPAARPLRDYLNVVNDAQARSGGRLPIYYADASAFLTLDDLNAATRLFDEAEAAVRDDEELYTRVRRARMPLDHDWLLRYWNLQRQARVSGKAFLGPEDPQAACEDFIARAHQFNAQRWREGERFEAYEPVLRDRCIPPPPATPPAAVAGLEESRWVDIQDREMALRSSANRERVEDPKASNGSAIRMTADHNEWAVQYTVGGEMLEFNGGRARWYVSVRAETKAEEGSAFQIGIYDTVQRRVLGSMVVPIRRAADGEYHEYDLGVFELTPAAYIYVAPMKNPEAVEAVYVDRMFAVAE